MGLMLNELYLLPTYSNLQLITIALSVFLLGCAKGGVKGLDMINIILMVFACGGKSSTGIVLPLLCLADILAVIYYRRNVKWEYFFKLILWIILGIGIGAVAGHTINDTYFQKLMALIVIFTVGILFYTEIMKKQINMQHPLIPVTLGSIVGFTTMIGNLAGAFANMYFLSLKINKLDFIGTAAWLFLIVNFIKLPIQIFYWKNITEESLSMDCYLVPILLIGFYCGVKFVKYLNEESFRKMVLVLTLLGSIIMLLR